jgi:hypothetical protein
MRPQLKRLILLAVIFFCVVFSGYAAMAAVECSIDPTSYDWVYEDTSTWNSNVYSLRIHCEENGVPKADYIAQFTGTLNLWTSPTNAIPLTQLVMNSTLTDSNGDAYLVVPLIHEETQTSGLYVHLCPFDDIACSGGFSPSPGLISQGGPIHIQTGCLGSGIGCCTTTVTLKPSCCPSPISYSYCTYVSQGICLSQNYEDNCIKVTATWDPSGVCDYCAGLCVPQVISLSSFEAKAGNGRVTLLWETGAEVDNAGFNLYRSDTESSGYVKINSSLIPAKGSASKSASYAYVDTNVQNRKTYYYKLEDIGLNGSSTMHGPVSATPRVVEAIKR